MVRRIGVLALQGDFAEHKKAIQGVGAEAIEIRLPQQLDGLDGLIIPGGESTTLRKLADMYGLMEPLRAFSQKHPTWGTCAGAILLAKEIVGQEAHLGVMDITIQRNAFGRQINSFMTTLHIESEDYAAVFIRAPLIVAVGAGVDILATLDDGRIVAAQQGHLLATSFHPELTDDLGFHRRFLKMIERYDYAQP